MARGRQQGSPPIQAMVVQHGNSEYGLNQTHSPWKRRMHGWELQQRWPRLQQHQGLALQPPSTPRACSQLAAANFNGVPSDSLAEVEIISPQLRRDIVKGKDVNLSSLLIPGFNPDGDMRHIVSNSEVYQLWSFDNRLKATLTIQEFILAFTVYRNVMCEAYPFRRAELDRYTWLILSRCPRSLGVAAFTSTTKLSPPERRLCCSAITRKLTGASETKPCFALSLLDTRQTLDL